MSHSIYTNLGSNQDPDDYRDQAVDREREAAGESLAIGCSIKVICSWCKKMMGLKTCVQSQHGTTSHSICEECKEKYRTAEALTKSNFIQP